ncbi:MAG: M16 family metallopeptidase [Alphaproteobacteria bacterium]
MSQMKLTTLPGGFRVVTDKVTDAHSVALGIWTSVGTRHEIFGHNGVAHMVEHMLFKGTKRRSTRDIAVAVENVGGHMNAYTSREITSYHIQLLKADVPLALDILADLYQDAMLPEDELERERQVILQEIGMALDTPDDLVFDNYYEIAYPHQSLGMPILGRADYVADMPRDVLTGHIRKFYTPSRTVISAAGDVDHDAFVRMVENLFSHCEPHPGEGYIPAAYKGGDIRVKKDLEQSHIVLGFEGISRLDEEYSSVQAYSMLLGGGMSSRLFQEVRENRGLVYSIYSFHSSYLDSGQFAIYAGTGPDSLKELVPIVCDELLKTIKGITEEEVRRATAQIKSSLLIARDSMMARADQHAKYLLYRGGLFDLDAIITRIDQVDRVSVQQMAARILKGKPTVSALGPVNNLESYSKISKRLHA